MTRHTAVLHVTDAIASIDTEVATLLAQVEQLEQRVDELADTRIELVAIRDRLNAPNPAPTVEDQQRAASDATPARQSTRRAATPPQTQEEGRREAQEPRPGPLRLRRGRQDRVRRHRRRQLGHRCRHGEVRHPPLGGLDGDLDGAQARPHNPDPARPPHDQRRTAPPPAPNRGQRSDPVRAALRRHRRRPRSTGRPAHVNDLALWIDFVERPEWFNRARCRDEDVSVFFPARDSNPTSYRHGVDVDDFDPGEHAAKAVCADCTVRTDCLAYGLHEPFGVWGGRTTRERRLIRKAAS